MQVVDINGNMFGYDHLEIIGADGRPKTLDSGLTSVGLSMPSAFTVSNSPLTSNGTIGVTGAGTTSQYIDGTGSLRSFPSLTGYVPYVGATQNVDLGEFELKAGQIEFNQTPTGTPGVAVMQWNDQDGTVDLGLKGGNVTLQIGQEQVTRVVNKTGVNLLEANYQTVRIDGAQGNRLKVALAQANNDANSAETLGIVTETINDNQEGFITTSGLVRNINTTGSLQGETWADGDMLYLSGTIAGQLTNIKPTAPIHTVIMGYVVRAHATQGQIYVKVDNGYELDELHNVAISSPLNNQGLFYETATQLWKNKSISTALGYTPVPDSRTLSINGTTYDLTANRTWNVGTVTAVTASFPLSSSGGTTPNLTISQASSTDDGYLSSADWTTFNSKQPAGNYITALSGEASGSGPGTASVTLNNASVTAKVLTGVNITGGSISASDSILTAFGKLQNQINGLVGSSIYQGTWNASTNTPALASGVGTRGYYYIVSVAGSTNLDGITDWNVGDWAIFDGTAWQQVDNTDSVTSVNGQTGAVSLTTDNIPEGATNLYFTNGRARQSISLTTTGDSGASTYNNTTGVLNVPNYTLSGIGGVPLSRTLTINGITYDLSADRTWSVGTVTSVDMTVPTGLTITGSPITGAGTLALGLQSGYSIPTTANQSNWTTAYNRSIVSAAVNYGVATTSLVLTQQNTGTVTASLIAGAASQGKFVFFNGTNLAYTSLNASAPLSFDLNTYTFSISQAGASTNGFLSSTDWNTFNNKQNAITLTTTGTSGPATLIGDTLNIPQYQSVLTNPVTGTGTANYVARWTSSSQISTGVLYDNGTNVGIGTTSPGGKLEVFTGGTSGWDKLVVTNTTLWGDGSTPFVTIGAGGATGIMIANPHIVWNSSANAAALRMGRSGGVSSGAWYEIGTGASDSFFISRNGYSSTGTAQIFISSSNYVGIGTTTPGDKLTVDGNINSRNTALFFGDGSDNSASIFSTGGPVKFFANASERMRINSSGQLLVGTTNGYSSNGKIVVQNGTIAAGSSNWNNSTTGNAIEVFGDTNSNGGTIWSLANGNQAWGNISISPLGGNVGIGTYSPSTKLQITKGSSGNVATFTTEDNAANSYSGITLNATTQAGVDWYGSEIRSINVQSNPNFLNPRLAFFVQNTNTYLPADRGEKMTILGSGNVGIGTTSPSYKLDLRSPLNTDTFAFISGGPGSTKGGIYLGNDGAQYSSLWFDNATNDLVIRQNYSSGNLILGTASTEKMRITSSGNVGIGTTSINNAISGTETVLKISSSNISSIYLESAGGIFANYLNTARSLVWYDLTAGAERMRITDAGNVGIGTSNPANKISISSGAFNNGATVVSVLNTSSTQKSHVVYDTFLIQQDDAPTLRLYETLEDLSTTISSDGGLTSFATTGEMGLFVAGSSNAAGWQGLNGIQAIRIKSNGRVGIGTTAPGYVLEVNGGSDTFVASFINSSASQSFIRVGDTSDVNYSGLALYSDSGSGQMFKNGTGSNSWGGNASLNIYNSNGSIAFHPNNTANAMFIATSGNVGIGTSSPAARLTVAGDGSGAVLVGQSGFGSNYTGISLNGTLNTGSYNLLSSPTDNNLYINRPSGNDIYFRMANSDQVTIKNSGLVGIGTTSPDSTLHVNTTGGAVGGIKLTSSTNTNGAAYLAQNAGGTSYFGRNNVTGGSFGGTAYSTVIYSSGAYPMEFYTNDAQRMCIASSGNVGIGTSNPAGQLSGTKGLSIVDATNAALGLSNGTNHWLNYLSGTTYRIWNNTSNEVMTITLAGNIGIGTTSPGAKLTVQGDLFAYQTNGFFLMREAGGSSTNNAIELNIRSYAGKSGYLTFTESGVADRWSVGVQNGNSTLRFIPGFVTGTPVFTLSNAGAGVFSSSVTARSFSFAIGGFRLKEDSSNASSRNWVLGNDTLTWGDFGIHRSTTQTGSTYTIPFYINPSGNVGIGTTNPLYKLHSIAQPSGGVSYPGAFQSNNAYGNELIIRAYDGKIDLLSTYETSGINCDLSFTPTTAAGNQTEAIRIQASTGNVGIGTTSPSTKLHVVGSRILVEDTNAGIMFRTGGTNRYSVASTGGEFLIYDEVNSTSRLYITSSGNVGIGTSSPSGNLQVFGSSPIVPAIFNLTHYAGVGAPLDFTFSADAFGNAGIGLSLSTNLTFSIAGSERMRITSSGSIGVATSAPDASAIMDLTSRRQGFLPPRMTNTEMTSIGSPAAGLVVYDTTNNKLTVYNGSSWVPLH